MKARLILMVVLLNSALSGAAEKPKTLFELSNVPRPDANLDRSVLVIIDAQQEYVSGRLPLAGVRDAVRTIQRLLTEARKRHVPIVHVMHEGSPGGLFDPSTPSFKNIAGLEPLPGEPVILKHLPDAFAGTNLSATLEKHGKDRSLILTGFMTHMCISGTAMAALNAGFTPFVVRDAVATRDLLGPNGETVPAQVVNQASLAALQDRVSWIVDSNELLTK